MTSRLRRMLLVNARTSGSVTSASINEIDPRGGAAITGDNAVGKTTTLELFPLFFGTLPSQITETVGGREPMLKFVLPMPQSAIVFEYQRGDDEEHDIRCAVLRRTNNDHRPVFRLIPRGFREEAFLRTNDAGEVTFCDDLQMAQAYEAMGAQVSALLDIAEYRAVILGTEARTQEAKKLRALSTQYGFGSRLTNLDRLIAAVAKERVDFKDFVRLAITIVQERLNASGEAPSRQRITLRQSREQIQRWLRDRQACESAFSMTKDVDILREAIEQHALAEATLRTTAQNVAPSLVLRRHRLSVNGATLSRARSALDQFVSDAQDKTQILLDTTVKTAGQLSIARAELQSEVARRESLNLSAVSGWASKLDLLPQKQNELSALEMQATTLSGQADAIVHRYEAQISQTELTATNTAARIRANKDNVRERFEVEANNLRSLHQNRMRDLDEEFRAKSEELSPKINEWIELAAALKAQIDAAQASKAAQAALTAARAAVQISHDERVIVIRAAAIAQSTETSADRAFDDAQSALERAQDRLVQSERLERDAQARLTPANGTLLSALRASPDEGWKSSLAKVLDPALLQRDDLDPEHLDLENIESIYGWRLQTNALEQPTWTDSQQLQEALIQAQRTMIAARGKVDAAQEHLAATAIDRDKAVEARSLAIAVASNAEARLQARIGAEKAAQSVCDQEIEALKLNGQGRLTALNEELLELKRQLREAEKSRRSSGTALETDLDRELKAAAIRLQEEISNLEQDALAAQKRGETEVASLRFDLTAQLTKEGVDADRLATLNASAKLVRAELEEIESHRPTVRLWKAWLSEGGEQILINLEEAKRKAGEDSSKSQSDLIGHNNETSKKIAELNAEIEFLEHTEQSLRRDVDDLENVLRELGLPAATSREADPDLSVDDLKMGLKRAQEKLDDRMDLVRKRTTPVRDGLTGTTSAVSEFIETNLGALPAGSSRIRVAQELCTLHRELARQVLPNVINEASVILQQVRQFRGVITRFEAEIKRFNSEFQKGLNVARFKRIDDFKVAIVANFSDLELMKEIDEIERVAREHEANIRVNDSAQLPDAKTAGALTKFLALLRSDSTVELDLASHVGLRGSVTINGETRHFSREADLEHISSTGINAIILISLLVGMLNMVRGNADVYIPWITDEVGKFDSGNFKGLMDTLRENHIDPVTASPKLTPAEFRHFERRYLFRDRGAIGLFASPVRRNPTTLDVTHANLASQTEGASNEA